MDSAAVSKRASYTTFLLFVLLSQWNLSELRRQYLRLHWVLNNIICQCTPRVMTSFFFCTNMQLASSFFSMASAVRGWLLHHEQPANLTTCSLRGLAGGVYVLFSVLFTARNYATVYLNQHNLLQSKLVHWLVFLQAFWSFTIIQGCQCRALALSDTVSEAHPPTEMAVSMAHTVLRDSAQKEESGWDQTWHNICLRSYPKLFLPEVLFVQASSGINASGMTCESYSRGAVIRFHMQSMQKSYYTWATVISGHD